MAHFPRDRRGAKATEPLLMAYPNTAHDRVMITLPQGLTTGALEFFDAQGRLVHNLALSGQRAFAEVNVHDWTEGIYLVRLVYESLAVADGKITIVR